MMHTALPLSYFKPHFCWSASKFLQRRRMDEDGIDFPPIFFNKLSVTCSSDWHWYHMMQHSIWKISYSSSGSIWGLSSLRIITIIAPTWKGRNKCCTAAKERPWSPSICIRHLRSAGCMNKLPRGPLIGRYWKASILLMHKTSRLTPYPSSTHCHTRSVALEGSPLCWFYVVKERWNKVTWRGVGHSGSFFFFLLFLNKRNKRCGEMCKDHFKSLLFKTQNSTHPSRFPIYLDFSWHFFNQPQSTLKTIWFLGYGPLWNWSRAAP